MAKKKPREETIHLLIGREHTCTDPTGIGTSVFPDVTCLACPMATITLTAWPTRQPREITLRELAEVIRHMAGE